MEQEKDFCRFCLKVNSVAQIKLHCLPNKIQVEKDDLPPNLFSVLVEGIFKELEWERREIKIDRMHISNLKFADAIVLFSESEIDMGKVISGFSRNSNGWAKSKYGKYKPNI